MSVLHTLRNTPWLAKLALLWFALTLGVAVASPMVNPQQELMICSAAGMAKVTLNADGSLSSTPSVNAQCPLCVMAGAPPVFHSPTFQATMPLGLVLSSPASDPIVVCTAALPPSRAPPAFS